MIEPRHNPCRCYGKPIEPVWADAQRRQQAGFRCTECRAEWTEANAPPPAPPPMPGA